MQGANFYRRTRREYFHGLDLVLCNSFTAATHPVHEALHNVGWI